MKNSNVYDNSHVILKHFNLKAYQFPMPALFKPAFDLLHYYEQILYLGGPRVTNEFLTYTHTHTHTHSCTQIHTLNPRVNTLYIDQAQNSNTFALSWLRAKATSVRFGSEHDCRDPL